VLQHEGDPSRCAVLLPGIRYFSQAPLLWFAREAARARGWSVVEVDERAPGDQEPFEWMRGRARRALDAAAGAELVVVVGKSLGSAAAPLVEGPAVWLTPLLNRPEIVDALGAASAPTLLVGSPDDPSWGDGAVPQNPALEVLELPGLDHSLQVSGDPSASLDALRTVTDRLGAFFSRLASTP
jgi:pimeloyl-ACP methyl ester carboxylesterase